MNNPLKAQMLAAHNKITSYTGTNRKPLTRLTYDVVTFLLNHGKPATATEIYSATGANIEQNGALLENLKTNPKILIRDGMFQYQAKYDLRSSEDILTLLSNNPNGIDVTELKDSYKNVEADVKSLVASKRIILMKNSDTKTDVIYFNEPKYSSLPEVSNEFKELWKTIQIRSEADLEEAMKREALKMTVREEDPRYKKQTEDQKKATQKRKRKNVKVTNDHLGADFFSDEKTFPTK